MAIKEAKQLIVYNWQTEMVHRTMGYKLNFCKKKKKWLLHNTSIWQLTSSIAPQSGNRHNLTCGMQNTATLFHRRQRHNLTCDMHQKKEAKKHHLSRWHINQSQKMCLMTCTNTSACWWHAHNHLILSGNMNTTNLTRHHQHTNTSNGLVLCLVTWTLFQHQGFSPVNTS